MTFETETSHPPESLPLPSQEAVFPEVSTSFDAGPHPLPPGEVADPPRRAALGEGSPSTQPAEGGTPDSLPLTPDSCPLTPLSPRDESLLNSYTELHFNLRHLAAQQNLPLLDVITWVNAPHIRPHLREIRKAFAVSLKLSTTESRLNLIDALNDVISTTDDLVEKRRASATLLRAIQPPRRPAKNFHSTGTPPNPSPSRSSCPSCSTSSRSESKSAKSAAVDDLMSLLNKDGTLNRTRLTDIADQIDLENQQALDTESDEDNEDGEGDDEDTESDDEDADEYSASSRTSVFSSPRSLTPDPRPAEGGTPSDPSLHPQHAELEGPNPSYTPDQVVDRLMKVLHTRTEIEAGPLGIARNFLSKESPLFRPTFREIAQQLMDFSIIDLQASRTWEYLESTQDGNTATRQVQTTDRTCGPKRVFLFTLTRAGPDDPWLLHDIKFHSGPAIKTFPNPYRSNNTS